MQICTADNYMDLSDDECKFEFTEGQVKRFQDQIRTYCGVDI